MSIITINEAKTGLPQAIRREKPPRRFSGLKDLVLKMDDSFDDELKDFAEYAPLTAPLPIRLM